MMSLEEWQNGLKAWEAVKKQGTIDVEQAEIYIEAIQKKISELK